ncbi:substrate-binding periplasmic protein [Kiloniella majae]|uniref:substrate-binding periplasmic protein n=1 Tax=Kiloniella majae TaxID=1938558 RepID=UPI000F77C482|nr:ABC transporter substrate-binding protein [Kiloniella majae]
MYENAPATPYLQENLVLRSVHKVMFVVLVALVFKGMTLSRAIAEELRLTTGEYPPFTSQHIPGGGVVSQLVELVFSRMGYKTAVDYLPWKRGYVLSKRGKYIATYPYLLTDEREVDFLFSAPIIEWENKIYVRGDSGVEYNSTLDLFGLRECLPHHYGSLPVLDELYSAGQIKRVRTPYIRSCWLMVLNGRADFFVEDVFVADIFRREVLAERMNEVVELEKTISTDYGHVIFTREFDKSEELVLRFNKALSELSENGEIAKVKESFLIQNTQLGNLLN